MQRDKSILLRSVARVLAIAMLACFMLSVKTAYAAQENVPTNQLDKVFLNQYTTAVDGEDYVYRVMVTAEANQVELHPPAIITFLLDGTASMTGADGTGIARDTKVREAVVEAFKVLISDQNENKENTFVNVVLFGSTADRAVSLTKWASSTATLASLRGSDMVASGGQTDHFIPLMDTGNPGKLNPILAQLFYCDYNTLALKSESGAAGDAAYPISQQYFFGNKNASTTDGFGSAAYHTSRFPLSSSGTFVNGGMQLAYEAMAAKMNDIATSGLFEADEVAQTSKYVMLLCDGDDSSARGTQSWAAAIKAGSTDTINVINYTGGGMIYPSGVARPLLVPTTSAAKTGLGGHIWTMIIGTDGNHISEQIGNYLSNGVAMAFGQNMMSIAAEPVTSWAAFVPYVNANILPDPLSWANYYTTYQTSLNASRFASDTHFLRTSSAATAGAYFSGFAQAALPAGGVVNANATGSISNDFDLFQYTDPKYAPNTTSSISSKKPTITMTAAGKFNWNIGNLDAGEKVTLIYYIQLKPEFRNDGLYHDTAGELYISFDGNSGGNFLVNFPENIVSSEGKASDQTIALHAPTTPNTTTSGHNVSDLFPIGTPVVPYTPSPALRPTSVVDEQVEEATIEMPDTGDRRTTIVISILAIAAVANVVIGIKRKKTK